MTRYASRKFLASVLALASSTWLVLERAIDSADYRMVVIGTVGAYIAGNVAQKYVETKRAAEE